MKSVVSRKLEDLMAVSATNMTIMGNRVSTMNLEDVASIDIDIVGSI